MDLFQKIRNDWENDVKPIIEDVYTSIEQMIDGKDGSIMFQRHAPTDLYTKIYKLTTDYQFDFRHIDYLYSQEILSIVVFCHRFRIENSLQEMNQHFHGFHMLVQWFQCFFHHLNRFRQRAYSKTLSVGHDMALSIRNHYIHPQTQKIQTLIKKAWNDIRANEYKKDKDLVEAMNILWCFDPLFYEQLFFLYLQDLQDKAGQWFLQEPSISYMEKVVCCFSKEEQMFLDCFENYYERQDQVSNILKKMLVYPFHQDLLHHASCGWKALLRSHNISHIKTAYGFFSHVEDSSLWSVLYQEFLEEEALKGEYKQVEKFFREQVSLIERIFTDDKLMLFFLNVIETTFQTIFRKKPILVFQMMRTFHEFMMDRNNMSKRKMTISNFSRMLGFCPDRDVFYEYYHGTLRTRLLSGFFDPLLEKEVLECIGLQWGASFVLNMHLMLSEIQENNRKNGSCQMFKLSKIVWNFPNMKHLVYKPPPFVDNLLSGLSKYWREQTNDSMRLEDSMLTGVVVMSNGKKEFIMEPIQAIVLMACENGRTYQQLIDVLGIPDDDQHNLGGVLDSLNKSGLIVRQEEEGQWNQNHGWIDNHKRSVFVLPIKNKKKEKKNNNTTPIYVLEAFIVRRMKQEKTMLMMPLIGLVRDQYPQTSLREIKKIILRLVDREFLSKEQDDRLSYVP